MPAAEARVLTENAERYLARLCRHASKMDSRLHNRAGRHGGDGAAAVVRHAEWSETDGTLVLSWGRCTLQAAPGLLTLHAEAGDPASLGRIQDLVAGRLEKFGRGEQLTVTWRPAQAPGSTIAS